MRSRWFSAMAFACLLSWCTVVVAQSGQATPAAAVKPAAEASQPPNANEESAPTAIRWWGQACVSIETFWGFTIVIDPFPATEQMGFPKPDLTADLVLATHEHFDHTGFDVVKGKPVIVHGLRPDKNWAEIDHYLDRRPNQAEVKWRAKTEAGTPTSHAVHVKSIHTFHDAESGAKRGKNAMFIIETDGVRILHCGDLGHTLAPEQLAAIGPVDVLLIPVGGTYTVDPTQAIEVVKQIKPRRFVWPIHFKTSVGKIPLATLDTFLSQAKQAGMPFREVRGNTIAVARQATKPDAKPGPVAVIACDFKPAKPGADMQAALESMRADRQALIDALGKVTKAQLDHKPSDGTHTIRWNFEHAAGAELNFFSQVYHAMDPEIPLIKWGPAQMPPDFKPRHPDWDSSEMVRYVQRTAAFTERFSYLLANTPADLKIEGTRFSVQSLSKMMVGHYRNHTTKAVLKFKLPDWPKE
ncbi:MAG TPA: MBL fold metallo-hydrolase [Phycisphaerae bacterium]|nr:MBL fold metallo-hydrolase [Phycisphaerae bacterium]HSA26804.1 MBL fold metallo-hydrolase [Phycisphaerae bacterium]